MVMWTCNYFSEKLSKPASHFFGLVLNSIPKSHYDGEFGKKSLMNDKIEKNIDSVLFCHNQIKFFKIMRLSKGSPPSGESEGADSP